MFVKLCGIRQVSEVQLARELVVSAIGINLVASSHRAVSVEQAAVLAAAAHELGVFFVIDAHPPAQLTELMQVARRCWVQRSDPAWAWSVDIEHRVDVVRLREASDVAQSAALACDLLISDAAGGLGGSGRRADWALSACLAEHRAVILAGGLTPDNVGEAIRSVQPFGVDVASGIEENRQISEARVRAFVAAARGAS